MDRRALVDRNAGVTLLANPKVITVYFVHAQCADVDEQSGDFTRKLSVKK
jgi:hypothetical protein